MCGSRTRGLGGGCSCCRYGPPPPRLLGRGFGLYMTLGGSGAAGAHLHAVWPRGSSQGPGGGPMFRAGWPRGYRISISARARIKYVNFTYADIKTGIFGRPTPKVHLGRAWRIEFPYRNIRKEWMWTKGRARGTVPRARPSVHIHSSRIFLYENSILHAWGLEYRVDLALEIVGRPNIPVLINCAQLIKCAVNNNDTKTQ